NSQRRRWRMKSREIRLRAERNSHPHRLERVVQSLTVSRLKHGQHDLSLTFDELASPLAPMGFVERAHKSWQASIFVREKYIQRERFVSVVQSVYWRAVGLEVAC